MIYNILFVNCFIKYQESHKRYKETKINNSCYSLQMFEECSFTDFPFLIRAMKNVPVNTNR